MGILDSVSAFLCHFIAYFYPAYKTYKAVEANDAQLYTQWLTYWIVNTFIFVLEFFLDLILPIWVPFYYECKVVFFLWLVSPQFNGAQKIYDRVLHPYMSTYEQDIDASLAKLREESSKQFAELGSNSLAQLQNSSAGFMQKGMEKFISLQAHADVQRRATIHHAVGSFNDFSKEDVDQIDLTLDELNHDPNRLFSKSKKDS